MTYFYHLARWRNIGLLASMTLLISCGNEGNPSPETTPAANPPALLLSAVAVNKFRASGEDWSAMTERLQPLVDVTAPDRSLLLSTGSGPAQSVDLLIAYRTGRNAVVAQLLSYLGGADFQRRWRTIVEPGVPIFSVRLTSGRFDPFGSLDNQWHLLLDVDPRGQSAIAVRLGGTELKRGHADTFASRSIPLWRTVPLSRCSTPMDTG